MEAKWLNGSLTKTYPWAATRVYAVIGRALHTPAESGAAAVLTADPAPAGAGAPHPALAAYFTSPTPNNARPLDLAALGGSGRA